MFLIFIIKAPLQYLLLQFSDIKETYTDSINYSAKRLNEFQKFLDNFYSDREATIADFHRSQLSNRSTQLALTTDFSLDEIIQYLIQNQYDSQTAEFIIQLVKKMLKYYGFPVLSKQQQSKYATVGIIDAQQTLNRKQVEDFSNMFTQKQNFEWLEFKDFLDEFNLHVQTIVSKPPTQLINVKQQWEWNMAGEWILKKLRKMDKRIQYLLGLTVQLIKIVLESTDPNKIEAIQNALINAKGMTYAKYLGEKFLTELRLLYNHANKDQSSQTQQLGEGQWDQALLEAIRRYQQVSQKLQYTIQDHKKPTVNEQVQSAADFIDSRDIQQSDQPINNEAFVASKEKEKLTQPKSILKLKREQPQPQSLPQTIPAPQPQSTQQIISNSSLPLTSQNPNTTLSFLEEDYDRKIRNALLLQNKILKTISTQCIFIKFHHFSFESLSFKRDI